ncbi:hypothetical protein F2P56_022446 [Juglans regia]|uniref:Uncharacterized protein LOC109020128 n=2 Tax=Juglans regia TaxID=51240 RepID=A0A2I4HPK2_JUGRE|nr:uncharacterized protein LOC109020128 [Juglans regia]XP_018858083.2 uncharacterized protein LOC109020128 [Juglans regia]XP_018858084.2 uncharacterized protein LOC109020128 [Juglans regia]KAF5458419.1 hypothetical protein F2P56_022446 [Juglans regia]
MSTLYPDAINAPELQIWNNAAFDNEESDESDPVKASWSDKHAVNRSESLESDCGKENLIPLVVKSPLSEKSPVPIKPLLPSRNLPLKILLETPAVPKKGYKAIEENKRVREDKVIDSEIESIEKEISQLSLRLEALRFEKAERNAMSTVERRGRIVPAKFMEPKQGVENSDLNRKIEEPLTSSAKPKINRRGVSLGPAEIFAGARPRQPGKTEITPVQPIQSRRKSCFWKLQDIDELKAAKERGKSLSVSPKSRKTLSKFQAPKQAATTVGSKRPLKKEDRFLASIQPKKLFKDGEKSLTAKKPFKSGRVVASRYTQISNQTNGNSRLSDGRKRSLPEDDNEHGNRCDRRRTSSVGKLHGNQGTDSRLKKLWEIPSEVLVYKGEEDESLESIAEMGGVLPKIRIVRCVKDTPRDSGPAKRVAELIGRRSYFCNAEGAEPSVCQALNFEGDAQEELIG